MKKNLVNVTIMDNKVIPFIGKGPLNVPTKITQEKYNLLKRLGYKVIIHDEIVEKIIVTDDEVVDSSLNVVTDDEVVDSSLNVVIDDEVVDSSLNVVTDDETLENKTNVELKQILAEKGITDIKSTEKKSNLIKMILAN